MERPQHPLFVTLSTAFVAVAAIFVATIFFHAQRTLHRAATQAATKDHLAYDLIPVDPARLAAANPGFQPIAAPASYASGAFFRGELYVSGATGLVAYTPDGTLHRSWRTGLDLPAAPLGVMVVGRLRGASQPELLIATAGEGVLILNIDVAGNPSLRQLRAVEPELRDLSALLPLPTGDLLIGTRHRGLLIYSGTTLVPFHASFPGLDTGKLQITTLAADASGFWAGTRNAGALHAQGGTVERIDTADGLPDDRVESIEIRGSHAYLGTPLGVADVDLASGTGRVARVLAPGLFAHALLATPKLLTIGSVDQGIQQLPLDASPRLRAASLDLAGGALEAEPVQQFLSQPASGAPDDQPVYAVTRDAVMRRNGQGWAPVIAHPAATLTDGNISALAFAPDGRLWVGFFDRGLDILSPALDHADHLEDDHLFCVNRLVLDPARQTMAAATANGLVLFDSAGRPRQTLTRKDGLIADHITDIAFTGQGMTLATPAGLTFVDPAGTQSLYAFQGLVNNHVYALGSAGGHLLAGTLGGISVLQSEAVERSFTVNNSGLRHNWITAIVPAGEGSWMIGTYGAGVMRLTADGGFEPMEIATSGRQDLVINPNALLATTTHIYAGTLGHGLLVYTRATGRWSAVTAGLPSLNVTAFAERAGQLYVGTENGLVRIAEGSVAR